MSRILARVKLEIKKGHTCAAIYHFLESIFVAQVKNIVDRNKSFSLAGRAYKYYYHRRNRTWENERVIEIPLIWDVILQNRGRRILEVGNVLSHYFEIRHDVVDKYEKEQFVRNFDIADYRPDAGYDLIVSISTLEHVGFDEQPCEPEKINKAMKNLESMLNPGGEMHITLPVGYNYYLDQCIENQRFNFTKSYFLKRTPSANEWREAVWNDVRNAGYFKGRTGHANGLVYAIMKK